MTQDNQQGQMTLERAIETLDQLLFEFAIRSGGGPDCVLIRDAEEAIRFLRSMRFMLVEEGKQQ